MRRDTGKLLGGTCMSVTLTDVMVSWGRAGDASSNSTRKTCAGFCVPVTPQAACEPRPGAFVSTVTWFRVDGDMLAGATWDFVHSHVL